MNPLLQQFLAAILRWALQGGFAFLVAKGILTEDQSTEMLVGLIGSILTITWILWVKYKDRLKLVTALASPTGTTERTVEASVKAGLTPSVTTPKDDSPYTHV